MNDLLGSLLRLVVYVALVVAGTFMFLALLGVFFLLAALWGLRVLWARITGKPAVPWVLRVDPRRGWSSARESAQRWSHASRSQRTAPRSDASDVTDVQVKRAAPAPAP